MTEAPAPGSTQGPTKLTPPGGRFQLIIRFLSLHDLRSRFKGQPRIVWGIAIVGYLLSPFSAYNDALINIPPSLLLAHLTAHVYPLPKAILAGFYYVMSNILGIAMMAWALSRIRPKPTLRWALSGQQLLSSLIYIVLTIILVWVGFDGIAKGVKALVGGG